MGYSAYFEKKMNEKKRKKKTEKGKNKIKNGKRKNCACLVFVDILGIIRGGFGFVGFLFPLRVG